MYWCIVCSPAVLETILRNHRGMAEAIPIGEDFEKANISSVILFLRWYVLEITSLTYCVAHGFHPWGIRLVHVYTWLVHCVQLSTTASVNGEMESSCDYDDQDEEEVHTTKSFHMFVTDVSRAGVVHFNPHSKLQRNT